MSEVGNELYTTSCLLKDVLAGQLCGGNEIGELSCRSGDLFLDQIYEPFDGLPAFYCVPERHEEICFWLGYPRSRLYLKMRPWQEVPWHRLKCQDCRFSTYPVAVKSRQS